MLHRLMLLVALGFPMIAALASEPKTAPRAAAYDPVLAAQAGGDENGMRSYVLVILRTGPTRVPDGDARKAMFAGHMANDPPLLVADEPTGNLDSTTAEDVFQLFLKLVAAGKTMVMVTHSRTLAARGSRVVEIRDGLISSDSGQWSVVSGQPVLTTDH